MTDSSKREAGSGPRLEEAFNNLSLGIIIFDRKREVVFCNRRYAEIYRLTPEQVKPGTRVASLIQHRLNLGLKVRARPEDYIRQRLDREIVHESVGAGIRRRPHHQLHGLSDGRRRRHGRA